MLELQFGTWHSWSDWEKRDTEHLLACGVKPWSPAGFCWWRRCWAAALWSECVYVRGCVVHATPTLLSSHRIDQTGAGWQHFFAKGPTAMCSLAAQRDSPCWIGACHVDGLAEGGVG